MNQPPLPRAEGPTAPFWQALRRHEFLLPRDQDTGRFLHPVEALAGRSLVWSAAPREGWIISYSWVHIPAEGYQDRAPYVLATVGLDNGPQLMCNIVGADTGQVRIGARVSLVFEDRADGWVVPQFTPTSPGTSPPGRQDTP
jgi:uncharacterized OB-fold protein